jgi:hypothetical protein
VKTTAAEIAETGRQAGWQCWALPFEYEMERDGMTIRESHETRESLHVNLRGAWQRNVDVDATGRCRNEETDEKAGHARIVDDQVLALVGIGIDWH